MRKLPKVSIIIPAREINDYIREAIPHILNLDYEDFEVLILPDSDEVKFQHVGEKIRVIPTGKIGPAQKRDLATKYAQADIFAFIDDDAFPRKDWLKNAIRYFKNPEIAAVCGPGITPPNNSIKQKTSGWVCASFLAGPKISYRYFPKKKKEVNDYPFMNFLIRKKDFEAVGGFESEFWPGEDTQICLKIRKELGKKIIYDPEIFVYHHRRPLFIPHLKQIGSYGLHRGHFVRVLPENSRRFSYFLPCLFVLGLTGIPMIYLFNFLIANYQLPIVYFLFLVYKGAFSLYIFLLLIISIWVYSKERNLKIAILVMPGIFLTHIWYGFKFIQGFFAKKLEYKANY